MRATRSYVAGVGTTGALLGAIGCAFAILSAVVAVHGWSLRLGAPEVATLDGGGAAVRAQATFPWPAGTPAAGFGADGAGAARSRVEGAGPRAGERVGAFGLVAPTGGGAPGASGGAPGATAPGGTPRAVAAVPPAAGRPRAGGAGGGSAPAPPTGPRPLPGGSGVVPAAGATVTQAAGVAGGAVAQAGQQVGGVVQGATGQVGATVGQVSPSAGQTVTHAGEAAGGVVSGAGDAAGQVVAGAGAAVGGALAGLGGSPSDG